MLAHKQDVTDAILISAIAIVTTAACMLMVAAL